jgi:hypothetical protein
MAANPLFLAATGSDVFTFSASLARTFSSLTTDPSVGLVMRSACFRREFGVISATAVAEAPFGVAGADFLASTVLSALPSFLSAPSAPSALGSGSFFGTTLIASLVSGLMIWRPALFFLGGSAFAALGDPVVLAAV